MASVLATLMAMGTNVGHTKMAGSGSVYTNNNWYTEVEYSHKYLKSMFNFLGIEDYQLIRVQGTAILSRNEILERAYREAHEAAKRFSTVLM
jgi:FMN-dependent NADH-azoreductase